MQLFRLCLAAALTVLALASAGAQTPSPSSSPPASKARQLAAALADELAQSCPAADPADQAALAACRRTLYGDSRLRAALSDFTLWGRQRDPKATLKNSKLTQFAPDVLTGMYISLFMFDGRHEVEWVEPEKLYRMRLKTAFRNRLPPGQFPYPFWHEDEKWAMYEKANELLLWWDPEKERIKVAQFTMFGATPPIVASKPNPQPKHDGKWLWTDETGRTQPAITLFDGTFRPDNPYTSQVVAAYKTFALRLRDGQCDKCHVPNNPDGMKKLVLLQSPAHAAAEIKRVLDAVREDRMPMNEFGLEEPLDSKTKSTLLTDGARFSELVEAAKAWESTMAGTPRRVSAKTP